MGNTITDKITFKKSHEVTFFTIKAVVRTTLRLNNL